MPATPNALVVTRPFRDYKPGDHIRDRAEINKVWHSSNHAKVVAVSGALSPKAPAEPEAPQGQPQAPTPAVVAG